MTLTTPNLWFLNVGQGFCAHRCYVDMFAETQEPRCDACFKHQVRAGIGHRDPGNQTGSAEFGLPPAAVGCSLDQAAFLLISAAIEIFIIEGAFTASGGLHRRRVRPA